MLQILDTAEEAVAPIVDGSTVLIGGFGTAGQPIELVEALVRSGVGDLVVVSNNAGNGDHGIAALIAAGRVRRIVCSYPRQVDSHHFDAAYRAGRIELQVVPQGTLAERIRAGGAGIGAFFTPTGYGTPLAEGKEVRILDGRPQVLEFAIHGDFALIKADRADAAGNLTYRKTARNFGPIMATACRTTVVQVREVLAEGHLDPEVVVTPGIFVDRVVAI
ncbi:MAG: 3-oxoacid CoA-transferase subunit A [Sporichthyaceae bacterium]